MGRVTKIDLSIEYKMMCQRATELQTSWYPEKGDFFTTTYSYCGECSKDRMCKECIRHSNTFVVSGKFDYSKSVGGTHWYFGGHGCVRGSGCRINSTSCYVMNAEGKSNTYDDHLVSSIKDKVWLPRQDQIQEMVWPGLTKKTQLENFMGFLNNRATYISREDSLELLWLRLFMQEIHRKKWNSISNIEKWESINEKSF